VSQVEQVLVSIIIPALNEARHVGTLIASIRSATNDFFATEIILVDNESTDGTPGIALKAGADSILSSKSTVAASRNIGAESARGEVLVFLDADTEVEHDWGARLRDVVHELVRAPRTITGNPVMSPANASWIERDRKSVV
jgi:glycosyltransferase involved in cell wall biosynthesis